VIRIVMLLWCCACLNTWADQHIDAYRIDTLVADQSEAERSAAANASLGDVILRVTGDITALQNPVIRQAVNNATNYLQQFSYPADNNDKAAIKLTLNYSAPAIEALLRQAQLSIWPSNRPRVLLWLVSSESGAYHQVTDASALQPLVQRAQLRGLPLIFPKWDDEDAKIISEQAVANVDVEKIKAASQRYKSDAILVGSYSHSGSNWNASWQLFQNGASTHFDSQVIDVKAAGLSNLLSNGVDQAANHLAQIYAVKSTSQDAQALKIRIDNVQDFTAFKQVQAYLNSLTMIHRSELLSIEKNALVFALTLDGDIALLKNTLALANKLQLDETVAEDAKAPAPQLLFHWQN